MANPSPACRVFIVFLYDQSACDSDSDLNSYSGVFCFIHFMLNTQNAPFKAVKGGTILCFVFSAHW